MNKLHPHDETARALVKRFCLYVFRLKQVYYTYQDLFEDEDAQILTEATAHAFFFDLNNILADYILLEVAKLTDPATSCGGQRENFTVANLIESINWAPDCLRQIEKLNETILSFRNYIAPARNRLLAHYDKRTVESGVALGSFPAGEDKKVVDALEQMCNVFHQASCNEMFGEMVPYHLGDVRDLKRALKNAIAFDKLVSNSKGEDLMQLDMLIKDIETRKNVRE